MELLSAAEVISRLERAACGMDHPSIATDADGTLWSGDVGEDAFAALLAERRVRIEARPALVRLAESAALPAEGAPSDIAAVLARAHRAGVLHEKACYELMAWVFAGYTVEEVEAFASRVQIETGLSRRVRPAMRQILQWAQSVGVEVWVVSASSEIVVREAARGLGIAPDVVIGARAGVRDALVQPALCEPLPYGIGKVEAVRRRAPHRQWVGAFGDNAPDFELLRAARVAVAVQPRAQLREQMRALGGAVELALD